MSEVESAATASATAPGMRGLLNVVENASNAPVTPAMVLAILRGEGGHPSHLRAVFGDASLPLLERAGAAAGIELADILAAYGEAKRIAAAANPELDRALSERF